VARWRQYDIEEIEALFRRVEALEARVAALDGGAAPVAATPPAAGAQADPQITQLVRDGRMIEAIELDREQTGVGLAEAKAAVERIPRI